MKKLSLLFLGILIGTFSTYFISPNVYGQQTTKASNVVVKGIKAPKGIITPKEAMTLDNAFDVRHALISESILKRPDNRSSWWSLEDIQDYLKFAKNESNELGYTMSGVRVYLGAYPTGKEVGYTTMFMVPTGFKNISKGSSTIVNMVSPEDGDVPGGSGLNNGTLGDPPSAKYPQ